MSKNSQIVSVSMPKEFAEFLDEHELSPSELLQRSIEEQMQLWKRFHTESGKLTAENERLYGFQQDLLQYIESISKTDDFLKWRQTKHDI